MKTTMKKLMFAALAALAYAVVPSSAAAATGDPCTLVFPIYPGTEAGEIATTGANTQRHVGDTVTAQATAYDGYTFTCWENYISKERQIFMFQLVLVIILS